MKDSSKHRVLNVRKFELFYKIKTLAINGKKKFIVQWRLLDAVLKKKKKCCYYALFFMPNCVLSKCKRLVVQCLTRYGSNRAFTLPYLFRERRLQQPYFSQHFPSFFHHWLSILYIMEISYFTTLRLLLTQA